MKKLILAAFHSRETPLAGSFRAFLSRRAALTCLRRQAGTLVAVLLLAALPAKASLSVVQVASNEKNSGTSSSIVVTITTTSGHLLAGFCRHGSDVTTTESVTDSASQTWTAVAAGPVHTNSTDILYGEIFYFPNSAAVTSVTCNYSAAVGFVACVVYEISGAASSSPEDTTVNATNDTASQTSLTSGVFTTTNANDILLYGGSTNGTSGAYTAGSGYNLPTNSTLTRIGFENQIVSSTQSSQTASISWVTARTGVIGPFAAFKAAGGGAAPAGMNKRQKLEQIDR